MHSYEIEIKSLLGNEENKSAFLEKLSTLEYTEGEASSQLNHYFVGGDLGAVKDAVASQLHPDRLALLERLIAEGQTFSVRTRQMNDQVILVIKASIDETTSENGISRIEFEETFDTSLDELDQILLDAGFEYQAKWSRVRQQYHVDNTTICLDLNAGYGYIVEFEQVVHDASEQEQVKEELYALMDKLGVEELSQERLARMFEFYNNNWRDYYGTEKTFTIE